MTRSSLSWAFAQTLTLTLTLTLTRRLSRHHPFSSSSSSGGSTVVKKVTRSNFEEALEDLRARVKESDFVAVDLEMTGVTSAPWRDSFEFDRSDVRYLKVKDSAEKFAVLQFGVCPFRWDASKGSFIAHPHNFYIFPRKELPIDGPSYEFLCQTSSLGFLAKYQFDFNACIHEGISYLSRAQEANAVRNLSSACEEKLSNSSSEECITVPIMSTADLLFTERMKSRFQEWCAAILKGSDGSYSLEGKLNGSKTHFQTVFYKMRPAVLLNGFSSHQLKLIKLVLMKYFKDLVYVHANNGIPLTQSKVVYAGSEEDRASLMKEVLEDRLRRTKEKVKSAVGFRHVIDLLSSEQKLVVGHNCFLDIAHIHNKFIGPLPSTMADFVMSVHKSFPHIIDTKHLLTACPTIQYRMKNNSRSLSSAFSFLCPEIASTSQTCTSCSYVKVDVEADETGSSCWNPGAKHEAGYDAFMTGCVFAQACSHLGIKFEDNSSVVDITANDKLQKHINLVYPSWNSGMVVDLSTGIESSESGYKRKYPTIKFTNIVLIWGFPSKLKPKDLKDCICKVFGLDSVTMVFSLDPTAAIIQFSKEEFVRDFLLLKDSLEKNDNDPISVLHPLARLLEGGNTHASNYDAYREICGGSASKVFFADQAEAVGIRWKTKIEPASIECKEYSDSKDTAEDILQPSVLKWVSRKKSDPECESHILSTLSNLRLEDR